MRIKWQSCYNPKPILEEEPTVFSSKINDIMVRNISTNNDMCCGQTGVDFFISISIESLNKQLISAFL